MISNATKSLNIYRHEHEAMAVQQLTKIKDMKSLSRLVRETTAQAQHQTNHLLGHVILYLKVRFLCRSVREMVHTPVHSNTNAFKSDGIFFCEG